MLAIGATAWRGDMLILGDLFMRKIVVILVVLALLVGGWWYASPMMTLGSMRDAAQAKDADALSDNIDFDALRADLKAELRAEVAAEVARGQGGELGPAGAALAMAFIDPMIDGFVTPEALAVAFDNAGEGGEGPLPQVGDSEEAPVIDRDGFNRFLVRAPDQPEGSGFVFERRGLGWKLVGVELPPSV